MSKNLDSDGLIRHDCDTLGVGSQIKPNVFFNVLVERTDLLLVLTVCSSLQVGD